MENILTPKQVADLHGGDVESLIVGDVRHWGHASGILYNHDVPVDVVTLDRERGRLYECYWRGALVAVYCWATETLGIDLLAVQRHAHDLMTPSETKRHREGLSDISLAQHGRPR